MGTVSFTEDEVTAQSSRFGVKVTYTDIQPAITSVEEAMSKHSFFEKIGPITKGDAAGRFSFCLQKFCHNSILHTKTL